jgi:hypothetical protein
MSQEIQTLHEPFAEHLERNGIPFIRARSDRESTIQLGHPDFTIIAANRVLMIEFKTKEGRLSKDQRDRIAALERAGNHVHVVRNLRIALDLLAAWMGSLGEIMPVATAGNGNTAPADTSLRRFGNAVVRLTGGRYIHVRAAGKGDATIPHV